MTYRLLASGLGILRYPWRRAILTYMPLTAGPSTLGYSWKRAVLTHRLLADGLDTSGYLWRRAILTFRLVAAGRSMLRYLWRRAILQCRLLASGLGLFRYFCRRAILTYRLWAAGLGTLRYPWRRAILLFRLLAAGLSKSRLGYFGDGKSSNITVILDRRSNKPASVVLPLLGKLCNIWQSLKDNIRTLCICSCVPEAIPCTLFLLETFYRKGYGHCRRPRPGIRNSRIGIQFFDSVHCASGQGFIDSFFFWALLCRTLLRISPCSWKSILPLVIRHVQWFVSDGLACHRTRQLHLAWRTKRIHFWHFGDIRNFAPICFQKSFLTILVFGSGGSRRNFRLVLE